MQPFDAYGVPTFYMTVAVTEPAGGGNVRIWNCLERSGMIVPVCEIIIPAIKLVTAAQEVAAAAQRIFTMETMASGMRH